MVLADHQLEGQKDPWARKGGNGELLALDSGQMGLTSTCQGTWWSDQIVWSALTPEVLREEGPGRYSSTAFPSPRLTKRPTHLKLNATRAMLHWVCLLLEELKLSGTLHQTQWKDCSKNLWSPLVIQKVSM